ncbi:MAG: NAD+ synthase [Rhodospirillales bacterium]|nr:NAD+ synthase [Rhodospirillales bacterium]
MQSPDRLIVALAQLNPTVGDVAGNLARIRRARAEAAAGGAAVMMTAELALSGYPPEDLVLKPDFLTALREAAAALAADTADGGPALLIGTPWHDDGCGGGSWSGTAPHSLRGAVMNAVLYLDRGQIVTRRDKAELPNYGVFDEIRVFRAGAPPGPIMVRGIRIGIPICEDLWFPDVAETLAESGAEVLLVPNASPYEANKLDRRLQIVSARVGETGLPIAYLNQVGGQDELLFDGASFAINPDYSLALQMPAFESRVACLPLLREAGAWRFEAQDRTAQPAEDEAIYSALTLGLRDYVNKNGFPGAVLGLSGGADSALSAAIAVDALGAGRVRAVMMPSPYTGRDSLEDAADCARLLGIRLDDIRIEAAMETFAGMLAPLFGGLPAGIAEENLQSRARGLTLMAISNKLGPMVLSTGNKSEMSVGYATLYGDMCGGFNPLKDVYKTQVYRLARWRNRARPALGLGPEGRAIPERILTKAPSAELRHGQTDRDSLPDYDSLDAILTGLIERETSLDSLIAEGHSRETVLQIWGLLDRAEYKRRQSCPGTKITGRSLSRDRRYPITNGFHAPRR